MIFFIVICHELGHAGMALFFNWRIKKIKLLPFGGVVELDEHGNRPLKEEILVIIAGPLQHIWLLLVAYLFYQTNLISAANFELFIFHTIIILFFNLLPIWPLDGGKLLFVFFSSRLPFLKAHRITILLSCIHLVLFASIFLTIQPGHLNTWIVFSFLLFSLYTEWKQSSYIYIRFLLERYYGKQRQFSKLKPILVKENDKILDVLAFFCRGYKHSIVFTDRKDRFEFDENELLHAYFSKKLTSIRMKDLIRNY